jgi:hypothetical protein
MALGGSMRWAISCTMGLFFSVTLPVPNAQALRESVSQEKSDGILTGSGEKGERFVEESRRSGDLSV